MNVFTETKSSAWIKHLAGDDVMWIVMLLTGLATFAVLIGFTLGCERL